MKGDICAALAGADLLERLSHWETEQSQMPEPERVEEMVMAIRVLVGALDELIGEDK
jgi:hypothetical protein